MNSNKVPNLSLVDITPRPRSPAKDFLLRLSPKRWSPESTPRLTPRSAPNSPKLSEKKAGQNLQKSISSPRKRRSSFTTILKKSPSRNSSNLSASSSSNLSLDTSPPRSPMRKSICHHCLRPILYDDFREKILAIKCTCDTPGFFCTPECHRCHWIQLNTRGRPCEYFSFDHIVEEYRDEKYPLALPLKWKFKEYHHDPDDWTPTIVFL